MVAVTAEAAVVFTVAEAEAVSMAAEVAEASTAAGRVWAVLPDHHSAAAAEISADVPQARHARLAAGVLSQAHPARAAWDPPATGRFLVQGGRDRLARSAELLMVSGIRSAEHGVELLGAARGTP
jgi:hypothetical protein